jgi:hypothetical protein
MAGRDLLPSAFHKTIEFPRKDKRDEESSSGKKVIGWPDKLEHLLL